MYGTPFEERTDWFPTKNSMLAIQLRQNEVNHGVLYFIVFLYVLNYVKSYLINFHIDSQQSFSSTSSQSSLKEYYMIPLLWNCNAQKVKKNLALFFYKTGTRFSRVCILEKHLIYVDQVQSRGIHFTSFTYYLTLTHFCRNISSN